MQLFFPLVSINASHFEKPRRAVLMDNVACIGQETSLADCTKTTYTFEEAKQFARNFVNVAGVTCNIPIPTSSHILAVHNETAIPVTYSEVLTRVQEYSSPKSIGLIVIYQSNTYSFC